MLYSILSLLPVKRETRFGGENVTEIDFHFDLYVSYEAAGEFFLELCVVNNSNIVIKINIKNYIKINLCVQTANRELGACQALSRIFRTLLQSGCT
jgi:hypothetical protein